MLLRCPPRNRQVPQGGLPGLGPSCAVGSRSAPPMPLQECRLAAAACGTACGAACTLLEACARALQHIRRDARDV